MGIRLISFDLRSVPTFYCRFHEEKAVPLGLPLPVGFSWTAQPSFKDLIAYVNTDYQAKQEMWAAYPTGPPDNIMLGMKLVRTFIYYWAARNISPDQIKADLHAQGFSLHVLHGQYSALPTPQVASQQQTRVIRARLVSAARNLDARYDLLDTTWQ